MHQEMQHLSLRNNHTQQVCVTTNNFFLKLLICGEHFIIIKTVFRELKKEKKVCTKAFQNENNYFSRWVSPISCYTREQPSIVFHRNFQEKDTLTSFFRSSCDNASAKPLDGGRARERQRKMSVDSLPDRKRALSTVNSSANLIWQKFFLLLRMAVMSPHCPKTSMMSCSVAFSGRPPTNTVLHPGGRSLVAGGGRSVQKTWNEGKSIQYCSWEPPSGRHIRKGCM